MQICSSEEEGHLRVGSDDSKKLKADLQINFTDRLFKYCQCRLWPRSTHWQ